MDEWGKLDRSHIVLSLTSSFKKRLLSVIARQGWNTKYWGILMSMLARSWQELRRFNFNLALGALFTIWKFYKYYELQLLLESNILIIRVSFVFWYNSIEICCWRKSRKKSCRPQSLKLILGRTRRHLQILRDHLRWPRTRIDIFAYWSSAFSEHLCNRDSIICLSYSPLQCENSSRTCRMLVWWYLVSPKQIVRSCAPALAPAAMMMQCPVPLKFWGCTVV